MHQLPVVIEVIVRPGPQIGFVTPEDKYTNFMFTLLSLCEKKSQNKNNKLSKVVKLFLVKIFV